MSGIERVLGDVVGESPGPLVVAIGGMHGNEPAGVEAAQAIARKLERAHLPLRGRFLALAGNLGALARGERYLERDLNRVFAPAEVLAWRRRVPEVECAEDRERRELLEVLTRALQTASGPPLVVDLHSTSADGAPFTVLSDSLANRRLARALPVPAILGLEERVRGSLLELLGEWRVRALAFEGGRHEDPATVRHHEAALWILLVAAGALPAGSVPWLAEARAELEEAARGLPDFVEIRYRHGVEPERAFRMRPGFRSFQPVRRGTPLAEEEGREVRAPFDGRVLLPLYQGRGDDGFFLGRDVRPGWLALSALLRRLHAERLARLLPGVERHGERPETWIVDRRWVRRGALSLFHLLGYRREEEIGPVLLVTRRREPAA